MEAFVVLWKVYVFLFFFLFRRKESLNTTFELAAKTDILFIYSASFIIIGDHFTGEGLRRRKRGCFVVCIFSAKKKARFLITVVTKKR